MVSSRVAYLTSAHLAREKRAFPLFADNVSSGEPLFALAHTRKVLQPDGSRVEKEVSGYASRCFPSTRMISAVFRRGVELAFVAEELKQVLDQRGGQWSKGRYVGLAYGLSGITTARSERLDGLMV